MLPGGSRPIEPAAFLGRAALRASKVDLLDIMVTGVVSSKMRHVIKRFLRKVGFEQLEVLHLPSDSPWSMRLVARGRIEGAQTDEIMAKVRYLDACTTEVLSRPRGEPTRGASDVDAELLRGMLAKVEPSMRKVYYTRS
jgi:hypothetical protein